MKILRVNELRNIFMYCMFVMLFNNAFAVDVANPEDHSFHSFARIVLPPHTNGAGGFEWFIKWQQINIKSIGNMN